MSPEQPTADPLEGLRQICCPSCGRSNFTIALARTSDNIQLHCQCGVVSILVFPHFHVTYNRYIVQCREPS